jgi:hypothetical protein
MAAATKAVSEIKSAQQVLDALLLEAESTLETTVFTLLPVFAVFMLVVGGCFFVTDTQRARLAAFVNFLRNHWNRFVNRNRVYNFRSGDGFESGVRVEVQGSSRLAFLFLKPFQCNHTKHALQIFRKIIRAPI